ncbi:TPA: glutaredoxin-like protein NrdH [Streptococcus suis]
MITIYSKPNCQACRMTKMVLDDLGVDYTHIDVTTDAEALDKVKTLGYSQMPVVEADGEFWSGFQPDRLAELVGGK